MYNMELERRISGSWKEKHKDIIEKMLMEINSQSSSYVLKGGTALMECYDLTRFSEDIDLDSCDNMAIFDIIESACKKYSFSYRIAKSTDTVSRFMIDYGGKDNYGSKPLKIEVSYRRRIIPEREVTRINGITVYKLDSIALMKANAYASRDRIRDLYDVVFIVNHKKEEINPFVSDALRTAMEQKGIEQFDYITSTQTDELIDKDTLESEFLEAFDSLGLMTDPGSHTINALEPLAYKAEPANSSVEKSKKQKTRKR